MKRIVIPIIISTLILAGCAKDESNNILGLWDIEVISVVKESLDNPPITLYTSNFEDIGKIFFKSNGSGALQIEDSYPGFDLHPIGASEFSWSMNEESFMFNNSVGVINNIKWNTLEFERTVIFSDYRERIIYKLKK